MRKEAIFVSTSCNTHLAHVSFSQVRGSGSPFLRIPVSEIYYRILRVGSSIGMVSVLSSLTFERTINLVIFTH